MMGFNNEANMWFCKNRRILNKQFFQLINIASLSNENV